MATHVARASETNSPTGKLTARELDILKCLARGMSDNEIANQLFLSSNTIKWYNRKIFVKLGVCSRTQAIARGYDLHILADEIADHE